MPHQNLTDHFWTSSGSSSYPKALLFPCDPFASVLRLTQEPFSKLVSDLVIFSADLILAIKPLEPADRKMAAGHVLEVLDERIVHRGAPKGADDRKCLRGDLLGHHQPKARRDLGDELKENGSTLLDDATLGNEPGGFGYRLGEHGSNSKIPACGCIGGSGASAQCEDLNTGENGLRVR